MRDFDATSSREDIINAYRLAIGRDPEGDGVIEDRLTQPAAVWFPPFFDSSEFVARVVEPIMCGEPLIGDRFGRPLPRALAAWAADFIPLEEESRTAVRDADDWHALFGALFADAQFERRVARAATFDPAFAAALETRRRLAAHATVKGAIESVTDGEVSGWAVDLRRPDTAPTLELFINGAFAGAAVPDIPRPDLGRPGRPGFVLRYAASTPGPRAAVAELRDSASGMVIGSIRLPGSRLAAIDALAETRRELGELRVMLDRIEARLPDVHRGFGFPIAAWDAYAATYYPDRPAIDPEPVDAAAVLDGSACDMAALEAMFASLFAQSARPRTIIVLYDAGDLRIEAEMLVDRWRTRFGETATLVGAAAGPTDRGEVLASAVAGVTESRLVLATAAGTLAPDAVTLLLDAIDRGALLAYADDDAFSPDDGDRPRRRDPRLRAAFDPDLLLQLDCLGPLAAIARDDDEPDGAAAPIVARALRLWQRGDGERIAHVPRVLFHRVADADLSDASGHQAVVRGFLARTAPEIAVGPHRDCLGAHVPGALSVRRTPAPGTRVAIVIPTRDRLDLLAPCLASISRSIPHNRVAVEVLTVDNRSEDSTTRDFLSGFRDIERFRVLHYDGVFNWAAINNHAAAAADADVLVFLNNDTVVLAPECWDVLAAQALRPSIGAVGARLLFQDGTIQHAGVVTDPWHSFASHEGVGDAGSDPGYLGRHALVRQVSTVTGACLATRADLFHEVGGFDTVFPFEGNDSDYCLRLRDRGYDILYDPGATLYHYESRTRGYNDDDTKRLRALRATRELRARWATRFEQDRFYNPHFDRLAAPFTRLCPPSTHGARFPRAPGSDRNPERHDA